VTEEDEAAAPAFTFTLALDCPAGTTTLAGNGKTALPPERATVAPPEGAAAESETVTVAVAPVTSVAGLTDTELSETGVLLTSDQFVAIAYAFTEPSPVAWS